MELEVKVVDGGLATEIEARGFSIHVSQSTIEFSLSILCLLSVQDDPLWSARLLHTNPSVIHDVHESYLNHGADIIITSSYQVLQSCKNYRN